MCLLLNRSKLDCFPEVEGSQYNTLSWNLSPSPAGKSIIKSNFLQTLQTNERKLTLYSISNGSHLELEREGKRKGAEFQGPAFCNDWIKLAQLPPDPSKINNLHAKNGRKITMFCYHCSFQYIIRQALYTVSYSQISSLNGELFSCWHVKQSIFYSIHSM